MISLKRKQRQFLAGVKECRSICLCGTGHLPEATTVRVAAVDEKVHTRDALYCKSTRCVNCAGWIAKDRARGITKVLCSEEIGSLPHVPYLVTLTLQSRGGSALNFNSVVSQIRRFNSVWNHAQNSIYFLPKRYVASVEMVCGKEMNAHVHVHVLAFYEPDSKWSPQRTIDRWLVSAGNKGAIATSNSQDFRPVESGERSKVAAYLAKGSTTSGVSRVALELQGQSFKGRSLKALLELAQDGSLEKTAYLSIVRAMSLTKLKTYRASKEFSAVLERASVDVGECSLSEDRPIEVSSEKVLTIPVIAWKEMNRVPLSSSLVASFQGCYIVRDVVEDLLLSGDKLLAEGMVEILLRFHHYRSRLSKFEYHDRLWLKLSELLL